MICIHKMKRCLLSSECSQISDTWSTTPSITGEKPRFTHSLLQQLFQAVDMWSVSSLPLHHHTVSAGDGGRTERRDVFDKRFFDSDGKL